MSLKIADLAALSKVDIEKMVLPMTGDVFTDPTSRERLVEEGLIEPGGVVTAKGAKAIISVKKRESELKKGIPFYDAVYREPRRLFQENNQPWFFILLGKDQIVTNGEMLFVGIPEPALHASRGDPDLKTTVLDVIKQCGTKVMKQLWPHSYQSFSFGGVDLVWFSDEKQEVMIPVQAKYLDYILARFQKAVFWGVNKDFPVQVKVRSKGVASNTVAIVSTFDISGELKVPEKIKEWRRKKEDGKEVSEKSLPVVEDRNRGSIRKGKKK